MAFRTSSVTRKQTLHAPVSKVWGLVGGFHRVAEWHPAVEQSIREAVANEEFRLLKLVARPSTLGLLEMKVSTTW